MDCHQRARAARGIADHRAHSLITYHSSLTFDLLRCAKNLFLGAAGGCTDASQRTGSLAALFHFVRCCPCEVSRNERITAG
jgi:hypothetical protein